MGLVPAIRYKTELEKQFAEHLYDDEMFFYNGYPHCNTIPEIAAEELIYQWVYVDKQVDKYTALNLHKAVKGYFAYRVDPADDTVFNFGLYSFDKGNIGFIREVYIKLEELIKHHRRIEWVCIGNNLVLHNYQAFCKWRGGYCHRLHNAVKDNNGRYQDKWIFEIVSAR